MARWAENPTLSSYKVWGKVTLKNLVGNSACDERLMSRAMLCKSSPVNDRRRLLLLSLCGRTRRPGILQARRFLRPGSIH